MPNAILVRLFDKMLRLETLLNGAEQQVSDESIDDTLFDLANYALMELTERSAEQSGIEESTKDNTANKFWEKNQVINCAKVVESDQFKKPFDWDAFNAREFVVHCKTIKEAANFIAQCKGKNKCWEKRGNSQWAIYEEKTCYSNRGYNDVENYKV
ncbi:hypothetical protein MHBO_005225, partial [Bonamia ostreae]